MRIIRCLAVIVASIFAAGALTKAAQADPTPTIVVAGTDISPTSSYTSLGIITSIHKGDLTASGLVLRAWGDRLTYTFQSNGTRFGAVSWGESLSVGYQWNDPKGYETIYAGAQTRTTNLAPAIATLVNGTRTGSRFELDAARDLSKTLHANGIHSFDTQLHERWTRLELLGGAPTGTWIGGLVTLQGNPLYRGVREGVTVSHVKLGRKLGAEFAAGAQTINGNSSMFSSATLALW